jgi:hypothetical protein
LLPKEHGEPLIPVLQSSKLTGRNERPLNRSKISADGGAKNVPILELRYKVRLFQKLKFWNSLRFQSRSVGEI